MILRLATVHIVLKLNTNLFQDLGFWLITTEIDNYFGEYLGPILVSTVACYHRTSIDEANTTLDLHDIDDGCSVVDP